MAKFGKNTLEVPALLGAYYERVHSEDGVEFDRDSFVKDLTQMIVRL